MKKTSDTIVFFGSGPVAATSLEHLAQHFQIEAVITKPHTEEEMAKTPGLHKDTPLYSVTNRQELDELIQNITFASKIGVIVDFGVIVSKKIIDCFEFGIINSHFSLLPRWRGADPISFAILAGDKNTGVSLMLIEPTLDTGKLLVQKSLPIQADDTTPSLTRRLIMLSNQLLEDYLLLYMKGDIQLRQQPHPDRATYSRKLTKQDGLIDWQKPAEQIEREIRAFIEWPKSHTVLAGKEVIITEASTAAGSGLAGTPMIKDKNLLVFCGTGSLIIKKLKPINGKEMTSREFLAGHKHKL